MTSLVFLEDQALGIAQVVGIAQELEIDRALEIVLELEIDRALVIAPELEIDRALEIVLEPVIDLALEIDRATGTSTLTRAIRSIPVISVPGIESATTIGSVATKSVIGID